MKGLKTIPRYEVLRHGLFPLDHEVQAEYVLVPCVVQTFGAKEGVCLLVYDKVVLSGEKLTD